MAFLYRLDDEDGSPAEPHTFKDGSFELEGQLRVAPSRLSRGRARRKAT
jgi:hypothetical protein